MGGSGSFRRRLFLALLAVAVLPTALLLGSGTLVLREFMVGSGTAGPWDQVAESGERLLQEIELVAPANEALRTIAVDHRNALAESVRFSRIYALLTERTLALLPAVALFLALLMAIPVLLIARALAHTLSTPIHELAGWTERIAREEPLPPEGEERRGRSIREFGVLRRGLRRMEGELKEARRREVEAVRLRSWTEMARRVAHELRNPLTPMRMAALTVARREDAGTSEASRILIEEIDRLDEMARSFAQFGRMPEGPVSEIDLGELLGGLVRERREERVPVRLEVSRELPVVTGRHDALQRVFRNLLVNAIEATEARRTGRGDLPPSEIEIRIGVTSTPAEVRVEIEDAGNGLPPDLPLDRLWHPDFTTKRRGTGIGLALVRQTVEAHGGRVTAKNGALGAIFAVHLPLSPPPPA